MSTPPIPPTPPHQPGFEQVIVPSALPPTAAGYPPPAPSQFQPQQPMGYPPASPPTSGGNTVVKVILIVVAVLVFFGFACAAIVGYIAYRAAHAVHRIAQENHVTFNTPDGSGGTSSFDAGSNVHLSATELGVPEYPGAKRSTGDMRMKTAAGSLITATFTTSDAGDKVVAFYKEKLGADVNSMEGGESTILTSGNSSHDKVIVTITHDNDGTKIAIMHTTHS